MQFRHYIIYMQHSIDQEKYNQFMLKYEVQIKKRFENTHKKPKQKLKTLPRKSMMGANNPRWNNGASEYPRHSELKRVRIEALKKAGGKCEACGNEAQVVHHIDESKDNHSLYNLVALCDKCHWAIHKNEFGPINNRTSKYIRKYGLTLQQLAVLFGVTPGTICYWIKNPEKEKNMLEKIKNREVNNEKAERW